MKHLARDIQQEKHFTDESGNPTGGYFVAPGISIVYQDGPILEAGGRNGAFVEDILVACLHRIEYYQNSRFACETNAEAIKHIQLALDALDRRTRDRQKRSVEGKHEV